MQTGKRLTALFSSILEGGVMTSKKLIAVNNKQWRPYTSTEFLPVRNFYKCVDTGDLRWILRGIDYENLPECTLDLSSTWDKIWEEFIEVSKDRDYQIYFEAVRKRALLEFRYEYLKAEIYTLYFRFNQEYADDLSREGVILNLESREAYVESLKAGTYKLKSFETKIELLRLEIEAKTKGKGPSNFEDLVDSVEQYRGQPIDIDTLSIKRFILMLNKIKSENGKRKN